MQRYNHFRYAPNIMCIVIAVELAVERFFLNILSNLSNLSILIIPIIPNIPNTQKKNSLLAAI